MDFDLKNYIPLITSFVALFIGLLNWRSNIKIKNQQFLISILDKDINNMVEVRNYINESILKIEDLKIAIFAKIASKSSFYPEYKEISDIKFFINIKIAGIKYILIESSQADDLLKIFDSLSSLVIDPFELSTIDIYIDALLLFLKMLDIELTEKRLNIKKYCKV